MITYNWKNNKRLCKWPVPLFFLNVSSFSVGDKVVSPIVLAIGCTLGVIMESEVLYIIQTFPQISLFLYLQKSNLRYDSRCRRSINTWMECRFFWYRCRRLYRWLMSPKKKKIAKTLYFFTYTAILTIFCFKKSNLR